MSYQQRLWRLPDGNDGVTFTLQRMRSLIRQTEWLTRSGGFLNMFIPFVDQPGPDDQTVEAMTYWVKGHMIYTDDPPDGEQIKTPAVIIDEIMRTGHSTGDCDDYVVMLGAMLHAAGFRLRLVVISDTPDGEYGHVYLGVFTVNGWTWVDPTVGPAPVGWQAPDVDVTARGSCDV